MRRLPGRRIASVARILYEHRGSIESPEGPLELRLDDGSTLLLDAEANGERLRVREGPWVDPFLPLTDENRSYVEHHGKWSRVECSAQPGYSRLLVDVISSV